VNTSDEGKPHSDDTTANDATPSGVTCVGQGLQGAASASLLARVTDDQSVIRVEDVNHHFGQGEARKQALFDNCLDIQRGEIIIMTGPSGSGKTTLLTLIGTLRRVQEGSLNVLGTELNGISTEDTTKLRKQIGFIFQAHNLFGSLTAFQNVNMAAELIGMSRRDAKKRIEELLGRLDLGHRIHYKPKSLSGGQRQRVAVARGLVHKPNIVLADEPTAALDAKTGREVVTLFQEMAREEGCTIIIVTHDNRILDVADRIVKMVDGRIHSNVLVQESAVICDFLSQCELFGDLTTDRLSEIAHQMKAILYPPNTAIIQQGDEGDLFYLIRKGEVEVIQQRDASEETIAKLHEGDFFGEVALIKKQRRNATVKSTEETLCYTLSQEQFHQVRSQNPTFEEQVRQAVFDRQ
jgi:putative ABC transport system ATP-binding protein